jgi:hypothetical protein
MVMTLREKNLYDSGMGNRPIGFGWNLALPDVKNGERDIR